MSELHDRLTDFCAALTDDGLAPCGVAVIIPETPEDAALIQRYGNDPAALRKMVAEYTGERDPEHVLQLRGALHAAEARETEYRLAGETLRATIAELQDGLNGATDVADRRGAQIDRLRAELEDADAYGQSEHTSNVRLADENAALRTALLDSATARSVQSELRGIAESNYAECQDAVGTLVSELARLGGLLRTAEYRLATFGYRPQ